MEKHVLQKIGLSEGEGSVYMALLRLGLVTSGPLRRETGLQSSSVYHILDSLLRKGIISFEVKNGRKYFYATAPERLLDFLEEKKKEIDYGKQQIERFLPQLQAMKTFAKAPSQEVLLFEGWQGVLSAFKDAYRQVRPGMTLYAYTITKELGGADPKQVRWLINKLRQLRDELNKQHKQKTIMKIIAENGSEIGNDQAKTRFTKVRFIDEHYTNPAVINIYGDMTIIALWLKKPIAFSIHSKEVSESFKNNFNLLWNVAK